MAVNLGFELNESRTNGESIDAPKDKIEKEGETWDKSIHFLMSCIAMSVGLGNIWRFPFTAYENGGGAFLIPYIIVLILVGRPIYFLEMCVGQFARKISFRSFESLCPILKGVAFGQIFVVLCASSYYCSLLALALLYLLNSFTPNLPWAECLPTWNDSNITCIPSKSKYPTNYSSTDFRSSSELWFEKEVLREKFQIADGVGLPDWRLSLCLLLSWFLIFVLSAKGIKSSGKASYFLALFPYITIFALFIRAVTLQGSSKGILYFLRPQWNQLLNAKVWFNAITQCFFSLNIGSSTITNFSSFNNFRQNIYRDALIVSTLDTFTSFIAGVTIFSILGNLASELGVEVTEVLSSGGARLAFVSYPDAISKFDTVPWLFSILFFLTLYVLGIGSLLAGQTCLHSFIQEFTYSLKKWQTSLIIGMCGFLFGLPYVTPGGQFVLTLVDYFGVTFLFFILTTIEVVVIVWWYGLENFCNDIEFMLDRKLGFYWKMCWGVITPCVLITIMIYFLSTMQKLKNGIYEFPNSVLAIGWCLLAVGLSQPLIWWVIFILENKNLGLVKAIQHSFNCDAWKPSNEEICRKWETFKEERRVEKCITHTNWFVRKISFLFGKSC